MFLRQPGRVFVEPFLSIYSPLCPGWNQRHKWDQVLEDLGINSLLTSTSPRAGVLSPGFLPGSADSEALKRSMSSETQALRCSLRYVPLYFTALEALFAPEPEWASKSAATCGPFL